MEHGRWLCLCLRETPARAHTTGMRHTCDTGLVCRWVCLWCGRVVVGVGARGLTHAGVPEPTCGGGGQQFGWRWCTAHPPGLRAVDRCHSVSPGFGAFHSRPWPAHVHPLGCLPLYLSLFNTVISNKNNGKSGYNMLIYHHIRPRILPSERMDAGQEKFAGHQAS